jgi:hypothetical protein
MRKTFFPQLNETKISFKTSETHCAAHRADMLTISVSVGNEARTG